MEKLWCSFSVFFGIVSVLSNGSNVKRCGGLNHLLLLTNEHSHVVTQLHAVWSNIFLLRVFHISACTHALCFGCSFESMCQQRATRRRFRTIATIVNSIQETTKSRCSEWEGLEILLFYSFPSLCMSCVFFPPVNKLLAFFLWCHVRTITVFL